MRATPAPHLCIPLLIILAFACGPFPASRSDGGPSEPGPVPQGAPPIPSISLAPPVAAPPPRATAPVDLEHCRPHPPAVRWEVEDDTIVRAYDAAGCMLAHSRCKGDSYGYRAAVGFMTDLQARAKAQDANGLAEIARYPLRVNGRSASRDIHSHAEFLQVFGRVFTPRVLGAVAAADPRDLFCNYHGVMLGDGIVWADGVQGHLALITINSP